jgi:hypothetical protein
MRPQTPDHLFRGGGSIDPPPLTKVGVPVRRPERVTISRFLYGVVPFKNGRVGDRVRTGHKIRARSGAETKPANVQQF